MSSDRTKRFIAKSILLWSGLFLHRFGLGTRRLEQALKHRAMRRKQEHRFAVAQNAGQLLHLLEERVELRVLALSLVADSQRFGVGLALELGFLELGLSE